MTIKHESCLTIKRALAQSDADVDAVVARVAKRFRVHPKVLKARKQGRRAAPARRAVCWALAELGLTNAEIGRRLHRDRSTIRTTLALARAECETHPEMAAELRELAGLSATEGGAQ